jgi:hypothetical protein
VGRAWNTSQVWDGSIDEVRLYNRSLTAEEVQEHFRLPFVKLLLKKPLINVRGDIYFEKLIADYMTNIYASRLGSYTLLLKNAEFRIKYTDTITIIEDVSFVGDVIIIYPQWAKIRWDDSKIPWNEILLSPIHITLIVLLTMCYLLTLYVGKRNRVITSGK